MQHQEWIPLIAGMTITGRKQKSGKACSIPVNLTHMGDVDVSLACVVSGVISNRDEVLMDISPQIEPTSTGRLLTCMGLAIDETKLIRSLNESKKMFALLEMNDPSSHRLLFLKKEISNLEARLAKIRRKASRMKIVIHLDKFK